ncbi:MAG: HAMP domain-containing histidine kinase [Acidimicrobiales bacterium]|nr:HAMP domain-containing histidine kinase [Acidimicrobiales bacterium]MYB80144.1 HAMP domain-containing histidine kinase [Acidimicrobiales bacterium]MYI12607.1 HAMP domain-containing histidine kinase [Acidimicrobiales bacterium]
MSFRTRLGLLVAASVAVGVLAVSGVALWIARAEARSALDRKLDDRVAVLVASGGRLPERRGVQFFGRFVPRDVLVQIVAPNGAVVYASDEVLPVAPADLAVANGRARRHRTDVSADGVRLRVLTVPVAPVGALMVASPLDEVDANVAGLRNALAVVAAIGVAGAGLLGFLVAGRAIRPVRRLTDAARNVAQTQDLDQPIELERDDELGELARSFNAMLEALAQSRAQQHRLVTDAGHELRTPLTSIRTNIELLVRAEADETSAILDADERRRMLDDVQFELDQLTELAAELVDLATDRRAQGEPEPVDLAELAASVVDRHRRRTETDFVTALEPCEVVVNTALVERAIGNLVDNAVKWSPHGEPIEVSVAPTDREARVRVRDRGPGIPAALRETVFERFYRAPEARSQPGSGLGLSIVDYVARSHDGSAAVIDTDGPGATVELRLPLAGRS